MNLTGDPGAFLFPRRLKPGGESAQLLTRCLELLDVRTRSIPLDNVPLLVEQRDGPDQEPAIFAVGAPQPQLILGGFAGGHLRLPLLDDPWNVVGMNGAGGLLDVLLQRKACVVQPALIEEVDNAVGPKAPGHDVDRVDDDPDTIFGPFYRLGRQSPRGVALGMPAHIIGVCSFMLVRAHEAPRPRGAARLTSPLSWITEGRKAGM